MKELQHYELMKESEVLRPDRIPIHPVVYDSEFAYTPEFVEEVKKRVPDSLREDISSIEGMLGKSLDMEVEDTYMRKPDCFPDRLDYKDINFTVDTGRVIVNKSSTSIALFPENLPTVTLDYDERFRDYTFGQGVHTWYIHNYGDQGIMVGLYLRNFAIVFNNLGLRWIP